MVIHGEEKEAGAPARDPKRRESGLLYAKPLHRANGSRASSSSKVFQPWLLGLTATVVFLFIVFTLMIINRVFCKKNKDEFEEENRERATMNVYDNNGFYEEQAVDNQVGMEETKKKAKWENETEEQKITAM